MVAAASLVVGCSGGDGASGGGELHVLVSASTELPKEQAAWFEQLETEFKAETGATLKIETFASAEEEQKKLQTSMVSGTGPDVYQLGTTFTPVAYGTGGFLALSEADWETIGGRDRFAAESLAMSGPDEQNEIGVPISTRPYGLVYNTEMFEAAGIAGPPTTWDELLTDARKLNAPSAGVYGLAIDYADGYDPWKYVWTLAEQSGGSLVSDDLGQSEMNSEPVVDAVHSYFELLTEHKVVDPASVGWESAQATGAFASGKAAILPMVTPQVLRTLETSSVEGKYEFAPLPLVPFGMDQRPPGGEAAATIVSGDNAGIAAYTDEKDLALKYLEMVTSKEKQLQYAQMFGDIPANEDAAAVYAKRVPTASPFVEAGKSAQPTAFTGAWADVQLGLTNVVTQSLPSLAEGGYDPAEVKQLLDDADAKVQSSLDRQQ